MHSLDCFIDSQKIGNKTKQLLVNSSEEKTVLKAFRNLEFMIQIRWNLRISSIRLFMHENKGDLVFIALVECVLVIRER